MGGSVFLGLGSNLGDRRQHLERAVRALEEILPAKPLRVSPVYESPAMLPENAEPAWNRPFLNSVVEGECSLEPAELLARLKAIESSLGRHARERWAPRPIDIDILLWDGVTVKSDALTIPHPSWRDRAFVLDPLKDLDPRPDLLALARAHPQHAPLWMAILNVTPDSFSDGGALSSTERLEARLSEIEARVNILDVGAESTRPGAKLLEWREEWARLEPVLDRLRARYRGRALAPHVSVDTRHAEIASRALGLGVTIVNDVSGLADAAMLDVLAGGDCDYVLMHSLSIPASGAVTMPRAGSTMENLRAWFAAKLAILEGRGIARSRVIIDPGIGFGKTSVQSLEIMRDLEALAPFGCRILVGHSRKSFIKDFSAVPADERDLESIGLSLSLVRKGVDILRVHDPIPHVRAFQAWNHLNPPETPASR